jgi:hypothetical protein
MSASLSLTSVFGAGKWRFWFCILTMPLFSVLVDVRLCSAVLAKHSEVLLIAAAVASQTLMLTMAVVFGRLERALGGNAAAFLGLRWPGLRTMLSWSAACLLLVLCSNVVMHGSGVELRAHRWLPL